MNNDFRKAVVYKTVSHMHINQSKILAILTKHIRNNLIHNHNETFTPYHKKDYTLFFIIYTYIFSPCTCHSPFILTTSHKMKEF